MSKIYKVAIVLTLFFALGVGNKMYACGKYFSKDKIAHMAISTTLTYWNYEWSREALKQNDTNSVIYSVSITALIGTGKEVSDKYVKKTKFSWPDMIYNGAGIALGIVIAKNMR
ncbi:MAG: hypothetical protein WCX83_00990 [Candidatus Cloacimonas sp.]|nr:hypothetical protein [Candidatus Cloacimonadota bacterium]